MANEVTQEYGADEKIIFSMCGVGKTLPHNNKVILKDIYLSFAKVSITLLYDGLLQNEKEKHYSIKII